MSGYFERRDSNWSILLSGLYCRHPQGLVLPPGDVKPCRHPVPACPRAGTRGKADAARKREPDSGTAASYARRRIGDGDMTDKVRHEWAKDFFRPEQKRR
jgi:hypothetical protein